MKAKYCTPDDLIKALEIVNQKFDGNVIFNREPEPRGKAILFTLRVRDSHKAGHRLAIKHGIKAAKHLTSARWHVHGEFFDALLSVNSNAVISTQHRDIFKRSDGETVNNWDDVKMDIISDREIYLSDLCDCE